MQCGQRSASPGAGTRAEATPGAAGRPQAEAQPQALESVATEDGAAQQQLHAAPSSDAAAIAGDDGRPNSSGIATADSVVGVGGIEVALAAHKSGAECATPTVPSWDSAADMILRVPGNNLCADCSSPKPPVWASSNIGVVVCIECSGVHRRLGAHVSKVLSLHLDEWTKEQIEHMRSLGNSVVNHDLEAQVPPAVAKPSMGCDMTEREAYIRAKYVLHSFRIGGDGRLPEVQRTSESKVGLVEYTGVLFAKVVRASNLVSMDTTSPSDPYIVLKMGMQSMRTKTVINDNNPVWEEMLTLNVVDSSQVLQMEIWDHDSIGSDDLIGTAEIPIAVACDQPTVAVAVVADVKLSPEATKVVKGNFIARCLPFSYGQRVGGVHHVGSSISVEVELIFNSLA